MKVNQIESYQKCLLLKTYEWHKKSFTRWFNQKKIWCGVHLYFVVGVFLWNFLNGFFIEQRWVANFTTHACFLFFDAAKKQEERMKLSLIFVCRHYWHSQSVTAYFCMTNSFRLDISEFLKIPNFSLIFPHNIWNEKSIKMH